MKAFFDHLGVVDLETLGVGSDSIILSLGLTVARYDDTSQTFDSLVQNGLFVKFQLKEQIERGRKKSDRVVKWWYEQSVEARRTALFPTQEDKSIYDIESILKAYFDSRGLDIKKVDLYDRNSFDLTKLQYLFEEELDKDVPWNYHNTFDIPTAFRFVGFDRYGGMRVDDFPGAIYHNPLHDAAVDHMRIYKVLHSGADDGAV